MLMQAFLSDKARQRIEVKNYKELHEKKKDSEKRDSHKTTIEA